MDLFGWTWLFRRRPEEHVTDHRGTESPAKDGSGTPGARYQGDFSPENLAFDSNLQEFAQRVAYVCALETAGKMTPDEAHTRIRDLYETLTRTHKGLGIGE
jgi:hypothetical protein